MRHHPILGVASEVERDPRVRYEYVTPNSLPFAERLVNLNSNRFFAALLMSSSKRRSPDGVSNEGCGMQFCLWSPSMSRSGTPWTRYRVRKIHPRVCLELTQYVVRLRNVSSQGLRGRSVEPSLRSPASSTGFRLAFCNGDMAPITLVGHCRLNGKAESQAQAKRIKRKTGRVTLAVKSTVATQLCTGIMLNHKQTKRAL